MRPVIGITAKYKNDSYIEEKLIFYVDAVTAAGAEPLIIAPNRTGPTQVPLNRLSGLLISGGDDIDPATYAGQVEGLEVDPARDQLELDLCHAALEQALPVLGICRGHQILNVALGGGLLPNIKGHLIGNLDDPEWMQHGLKIDPESTLHSIFDQSELTVNSRHHQVIDPSQIGRGLKVTAYSEDGLIEAVELPSHQWTIGVQWHPERRHEVTAEQLNLFQAFAEAAQHSHRVFPVSLTAGGI